MKNYRSNYIVYLTLRFLPILIFVVLLADLMENEDFSLSILSTRTIAVTSILILIQSLLLRFVKEAVVSKEGIVLNQRIPIEWTEVEYILLIPVIQIFAIRFYHKESCKTVIFPAERLYHEVILGLKDDNMMQVVNRMKEKYKIG